MMQVTERLSHLAAEVGERFDGAANRPIRLDDPRVVWFVETGALDVFLIEQRGADAVSHPQHLLRAGAGRLVFGVAGGEVSLTLIAKGLPGSQLHSIPLAALRTHELGDVLAAQVDAWLSDFAATVAGRIDPRPRPDLLAGAGERLEAEAGQVLSVRPGGVVWVDGAGAAYLGTEEPPPGGTGLVPLTSDTWLTPAEGTSPVGISSAELSADGRLVEALGDFHRMALAAEQLNRRLALVDEANLQTDSAAHRRLDSERARRSLFEVLAPAAAASSSALMAALALIGRHEGIAFRTPAGSRLRAGEDPPLGDVLDASGVRYRRVRLSSEDRWWLGDSGAMLGFRRDDGHPVALLPGRRGRYRVVDPTSGHGERLDAGGSTTLAGDAWFFYRALPDDEPVRMRTLARFAGRGTLSDLSRFSVSGLLAGLLLLAPAVAVGVLVGWVLPTLAGGALVRVVVAVVASGLVGALLVMLQGTALMRIEGRVAARLGAAVWDRLLRLPSGFFKRYTAGDLAVRMSVFQTLRDLLSGAVAGALFSVVFLLPAFGLLFFYSTPLAWVSLGLGLVALAITSALGFLQVDAHRSFFAAARRLSGELLQFINGMSKLRSTGAEPSAFASWARGYRQQQLAKLRIARLNEHLVAFSLAMPAIATAVLFAVALQQGPEALAISDFLVVHTVSMVFYGAVVGLGRSSGAVAAVVAAYEQVEPILAALPERSPTGGAEAELQGGLQLDHVSFRYGEDSPVVLEDVSIGVRPGEFVAIVGESGAGKSTLLRLALGLEDPTVGAVYYDGADLAQLDRRSVRRQIGVVAQDSPLQPGNILENIVGVAGDLTIDDAWRAARLAAVDADIAAMPMGMFTVVGDSSEIFSGGQMQRIRIAAALVRNPRILLLDEATSWLDAGSQAKVMEGIESLAATRIVIAHRLSTIRRAERIFVLSAGRVVQQGGFDELRDADGPFRLLAQRQMA